MSLPDIGILYQSMLEWLDEMRQTSQILQPLDMSIYSQVKSALLNPKQSLLNLGSVATLVIPNRNAGLYPISRFNDETNTVLTTTGYQFFHFTNGWLFFYANCGPFIFTVSFFAIPIANPRLSRKYFDNRADFSHIFTVSGGVGVLDPITQKYNWTTFPQTFAQGTSNDGGGIIIDKTWNLTFKSDTTSPLQSATLTCNGFGQYSFQVVFPNMNLSVSYTSIIPPTPNGKQGCNPGCASNLGSMYWSAPYCKVTGKLSLPQSGGSGTVELNGTGVGWIDHQWVQTGSFRNPGFAIMKNITSLLSTPHYPRWLWICIQKSQDQAYMIYVDLGKNLPQINQQYRPNFVNLYSSDATKVIPVKNSIVRVTSIETTPGGYVAPTGYQITFLGDWTDTFTLRSLGSSMFIVNPLGILSWEGSGVFSTQDISNGYCFLEANFSNTDENLVKTFLAQANIPTDEKTVQMFSPNRPPITSVFISIFITYLIIYLLFLAIKKVATMIKHRNEPR